MALAQTNLQLYAQLLAAGWSSADLQRARQGHDLAAELFVGRHRASGKPFLVHLVGTASAAAAGGLGPEAVLAGLLHAAYSQADWGDPRAGDAPSHRAEVRTAVGTGAEALVHAYSRQPWSATVANDLLGRVHAQDPPGPAVLALRLANLVDDHLDGGLGYSVKRAAHEVEEPDLATAEALARELGHEELAGLLASVWCLEPPAAATALVSGAPRSFTLAARSSSPRLRRRIRGWVRAVRARARAR